MPKKMKTTGQLQRIFGLAKPVNCSKEDLEELAFDVTNARTDRLSKLYFDEANLIIERLGGTAFRSSRTPRRTMNYRKKKAGVTTLVTQRHLGKMKSEWFKKSHRTERGLMAICQRTIKKDVPRTAQECNKVIEAIKSMNKRDAKPQTKTGTQEAA